MASEVGRGRVELLTPDVAFSGRSSSKVPEECPFKFLKMKGRKDWSGREDLTLVPNQIPPLIEIFRIMLFLSDCY